MEGNAGTTEATNVETIEAAAAIPENNTTALPPVPQPEDFDDSQNPLGWEFNPSHEANLFVLRKKIAGKEVNLDRTLEVEGGFYSQTPSQIFANKPFAYKNKYLAMATKSFKNKGEKSFNRQVTSGGSWVGKGKLTAVVDSRTGATIGTRSKYKYCSGSTRAWNVPTKWRMTEYSSMGEPASNTSLCCVYEAETKKENADAKKEQKLEKALRRAEVAAATAKIRAERTAAVAKTAETDMKEKDAVVKSLKRARDGSDSSGSNASGLKRLSAARASGDEGAGLQTMENAPLGLNDEEEEEAIYVSE